MVLSFKNFIYYDLGNVNIDQFRSEAGNDLTEYVEVRGIVKNPATVTMESYNPFGDDFGNLFWLLC